MQAFEFDTSSFIDFGASPMTYEKDGFLGDDIFTKNDDQEWSFLEADLSAMTTELNGGISKNSCVEQHKQVVKGNAGKFCEKLAIEILAALNDIRFCDRMSLSFIDILKHVITIAEGDITNLMCLKLYPLTIITSLWKEKMSLINTQQANGTFDQSAWCSLFSLEELPTQFERISSNYADVGSFVKFNTVAGKEIFLSTLKKLLVTCNVILVNEVLLKKIASDQGFRAEVSNVEDYVLMANEYWLYKHYNHSSQKFALECCQYCKVCSADNLPENFLEKLEFSRIRFRKLLISYEQLGAFNKIETSTETITMLFTFWSQILWI